jgi:hypothetical protein
MTDPSGRISRFSRQEPLLFYQVVPQFFPALLPFLNASWKLFCEGVQHCLQYCLDHLNCVKMPAFQFYLQSGKQRKVGWLYESHVVFGQKFSGEKGNVRRCVVVMQQPVLLSPVFGANSSHISMQLT